VPPRIPAALGLALLFALAGCVARAPLNARLEARPAGHAGSAPDLSSPGGSSDLLLVLAFSGGGTRAAALAYGALEALDDVELPGGRTLLDEVDTISGVSGGSFTAAYYGLRGRAIFEEFESRFLRRRVDLHLAARLLFPINWLRLASPRFARGDVAAEWFDRHVFDRATFADLREGPGIAIQATDMGEGTRFGFTPEQFHVICSDLSTYPVARAVAASSAVPIVLTPITLRNHAADCPFAEPAWVAEALEGRDVTSRRFRVAQHARAYRERSWRRWIHLIDGGIVDNLGLRGPLEALALRGNVYGADARANGSRPARTRRVAFVIVNAQTPPDPGIGLLDLVPGVGQILSSVTSIQINRYNYETIELLRRSFETWSLELRDGGRGVEFYAIEVSFDALRDAAERESLGRLPTRFALSDDAVDRLRTAARTVLLESNEFARLLRDLGGEMRDYPGPAVLPGPAGR
jgi:NTE family protein